ncbi:hypothetical protein F5Y13DRAFT_193479 [Hypoxylon sp. FL1857]|nr:hypothetical protein F5Y13DRAFT_193479 [Hypoxylon sp. FL1857]
MEMVLEVATESLMEKTILCLSLERLIEKMGLIEIFCESIRNVADDETRLFRDFLTGLPNWRVEQTPQNRYHIISPETELLYKIRNIRDELHMLRSLAEDQDIVWKQAFSPSNLRGNIQYYHSCTPTNVKKNIDEMLLKAENTTDYINALLDLRQAEYSRQQAKDSANLSNSILIFTLITIVFYEARWLFPIMFDVTTAVSIVSIPAIILSGFGRELNTA